MVQVALVLSAEQRPDAIFAFRMFNESSTISIALARRVQRADGTQAIVPTDGHWTAQDGSGVTRHFRWSDRISDPILATLGRPVHASYGVRTQLFRLQGALDDVMAHARDDLETKALLAEVEVRRNGHPPYTTRLESAR